MFDGAVRWADLEWIRNQWDGPIALKGVLRADEVEVLFDSGIRRGSDIVTALSLGAHAVLAGRAHLYGLAAAGAPGVRHAIGFQHGRVPPGRLPVGDGGHCDTRSHE